MENEIWRVVCGYENYSVSNFGNVKNVKNGKILKPSVNSVGYKVVNLGSYDSELKASIAVKRFLDNN